MKNLQEATERICDLKGSVLALDALVSALVYILPQEARAELLQRFDAHAEVARTVLLQAEISEHTISAFERDVTRAHNIVNASMRLPQTERTPTTTPQTN
jgi:membrane carboxypeptidase/penicillin-binding protein PbpC